MIYVPGGPPAILRGLCFSGSGCQVRRVQCGADVPNGDRVPYMSAATPAIQTSRTNTTSKSYKLLHVRASIRGRLAKQQKYRNMVRVFSSRS